MPKNTKNFKLIIQYGSGSKFVMLWLHMELLLRISRLLSRLHLLQLLDVRQPASFGWKGAGVLQMRRMWSRLWVHHLVLWILLVRSGVDAEVLNKRVYRILQRAVGRRYYGKRPNATSAKIRSDIYRRRTSSTTTAGLQQQEPEHLLLLIWHL